MERLIVSKRIFLAMWLETGVILDFILSVWQRGGCITEEVEVLVEEVGGGRVGEGDEAMYEQILEVGGGEGGMGGMRPI